MKHFFYNIAQRLGIESARTKHNTKEIIFSFLFKALGLGASFLLVPMSLDVLDEELYGVWITLSSFVAWFSFFDIGIGSALRNKFAEALARGNHIKARAYVSISYFTITGVAFFVLGLFSLIHPYVDWYKVFNVNPNSFRHLPLLMWFVFAIFCVQLFLNLITTLYLADQKPSVRNLITFITHALSLPLVWLLIKAESKSMLLYGGMLTIVPVVILFGATVIGFTTRFKAYVPTLKLWKRSYLKTIFGLSVKFFLLQISWVLITSADNMLITQLISPEDVVSYSVSLKLFSIPLIIFMLIATPFWSAFTEAHEKKDFHWIEQSIKSLEKFIWIFITLSLVLLSTAQFIYPIWLNNEVVVSFWVDLSVCLFYIAIIINTPYNFYINGRGKILLHLISTTVMAILNIPLSIFLSKTMGWGVSGILFATVVCIAPVVVITRIQFTKLITNNATGIWNK